MSETKTVYCEDESKLQEIFDFLFDNQTPFLIVAAQTLIMSEEGFVKLSLNKWFEVKEIEPLQASTSGKGRRYIHRVPHLYQDLVLPPQQRQSDIEIYDLRKCEHFLRR